MQRELLVGSYSSLIASLGIALLVLFLTSGNLFIAVYALITIAFAIGKSKSLLESVLIPARCSCERRDLRGVEMGTRNN